MVQIALPTSKSISARALVINTLAGGSCELQNLSPSDDTRVLAAALANRPQTVDIGAAGTAMRFSTAYFASCPGEEHILTGTERMQHRPIRILVDALRALGADIEYLREEGFPPLLIRGRKLQGGAVTVPADISSQYISALMMVAPTFENGLRLQLEGKIASRPYIEMTMGLMKAFGATADFTDHTITIPHADYHRTTPFAIERDWSAASYWYEIVALSPDATISVNLPGLVADSLQGDSCCAERFVPLGVKTTFTAEGAVLTKEPHDSEDTLRYDFSACPDLAQTFVVTAALQNRPFEFIGLESLKIKETNRVAALMTELTKLGYLLEEPCEGALSYHLHRRPAEDAPSIATYEDHRMAMAFAPAVALYPSLHIEHPEVVSKSYPAFWEDFSSLHQ